jgi:hypothetical protein
VWKFHRVNILKLNTALSNFDWDSVLDTDNPDEASVGLSRFIMSFFENCIPHYNKLIKSNDMPWMTSNVRRALNRRNECYRNMLKNHTATNVKNYKDSLMSTRNLISFCCVVVFPMRLLVQSAICIDFT